MVEVFRTNVESKDLADLVLRSLKKKFPGLRMNFDLNDCDKILRVEGNSISAESIIEFMRSNEVVCQNLE